MYKRIHITVLVCLNEEVRGKFPVVLLLDSNISLLVGSR